MTETQNDTDTFTVSLTTPTPPAPTITAYTLPPTGVIGATITPCVTLHNNSPTQSISVTIIVSGTHVGNGYPLSSGGVNANIAAGNTIPIDCPIDIPIGADAGDYELTPVVYWTDEYPTGDPIAIGSTRTIDISPTVTPAQGEFENVDVPTSVDQGAEIDVTFDVHNTGGEPGSFIVRAYMYNPTTDAYDIQVGDAWSDNISPNETVTDIPMNWTAPATGTSANYELVLSLVT